MTDPNDPTESQQPTARGEIHLGDLLLALKKLPWKDDAQAAAIARSLGFSLEELISKEITPNAIFDNSRFPEHQKTVSPSQNQPPGISVPPPPKPTVELPSMPFDSPLKPLEARAAPQIAETPAWLNENNTTLNRDETPPVPLHRESLFSDNTNRGILSAALATRRPGYQIDIFRLIYHFVTGKIPRTLPRLMSNTLERGCQLLLHYSDDMVPYWEDLAALATQIKNVMGQDRVDLYEFKGLPDSANTWVPPKTFKQWQPVSGIPVLVATDLGIDGSKGENNIAEEWLPFIHKCESAGAPLLLLIPWQRQYWPENLGDYPFLIHWNPHTSAAMIRRLIGPGHGVIS